jgi:hypothetical protein
MTNKQNLSTFKLKNNEHPERMFLYVSCSYRSFERVAQRRDDAYTREWRIRKKISQIKKN